MEPEKKKTRRGAGRETWAGGIQDIAEPPHRARISGAISQSVPSLETG